MDQVRTERIWTIGPFTALAVMGQGGTGTVWRAEHVGGTEVAVKVLTEVDAEAAGEGAFHGEVRAIARLDHPAIPLVLDYGVVSSADAERSGGALHCGAPYLVTELAQGSLRSALPRTWEEVRDVLVAVLDALAHAHARGIVHRDVKLSNVLVGGARSPWLLADFGLARVVEELTGEPASAAMVGTPAYMAPEQCEGRAADFGPWTDLYGVGCLGWVLVTGRTPFGTGVGALYGHVASPRPALKPALEVPPWVAGWLHWLMARDPRDRPAHAAEARAALLGAPRPAVPEPWRSGAPRSPAPPALVEAGLRLFGLRELPAIGRHPERDQLWDALTRVCVDRRPAVVLLEGAAGSGKSRLAQWLCEEAHERGVADVARATHAPDPGPRDGLPPMVRRWLAAEGDAAVDARLVQLGVHAGAADQASLRAWLAPGGGGALAPEDRYRWILRLIAARDHPVVLWLDDLQWGIDAIELARASLERAGLPLLIVATVQREALAERPVEQRATTELRTLERVRSVEVGSLAPEDRAALIGALLHLEPPLARELEARTAGNALFTLQLVGDWVERRVLELGPDGFRLRAGAATPLPADLQATWTARVDRLIGDLGEPGGELALQLAAVLGQRVDLGEWRAVGQRVGAVPTDALIDELVARRLAVPADGGLSLVHGMLREALTERARAAGDAARLHLVCAEVLDDGGRRTAARVGRHRLAAGDLEGALGPLHLGAQHAIDSGDFGETELLVLARERALASLGVHPDDPRHADSWALRANLDLLRGRFREAIAWAERAAALLRPAPTSALVHALFRLGEAADALGEGDRALAVLEEAVAVGQALGDRAATARAEFHRMYWHLNRGRLDWAESEVRRLQAAGWVNPPDAELVVARIRTEQLRLAEARSLARSARAGFAERGFPEGEGHAVNVEADVARIAGRLDEAEALYRDATSIFGDMAGGVYTQANLGLLALARSQWDAGRDLLASVGRRLEALGQRPLLEAVRGFLLPCAVVDEDDAAWEARLAACHRDLDRSGRVYVDMVLTSGLAASRARAVGRPDRAAQAEGLGRRHAEVLGVPV